MVLSRGVINLQGPQFISLLTQSEQGTSLERTWAVLCNSVMCQFQTTLLSCVIVASKGARVFVA